MVSATPLTLIVTITVSSGGLPPKMVDRAIREADAIWRDAGVSIDWHRGEPPSPESVDVRFVDDRGHAEGEQVALAWIDIIDDRPSPEIHVSHLNAVELLERARLLSPAAEAVPAALNEFVGRALGRALAHELGHYLFASREHDRDGVMATGRAPTELFGTSRSPFLLTVAERLRLSQVIERRQLLTAARSPLRGVAHTGGCSPGI